MTDPMIYILAPFGLAFGLFVVYLVVSIFLKDPVRPFRMFKAPPLELEDDSSESRGESSEEGQGGPEEEQEETEKDQFNV